MRDAFADEMTKLAAEDDRIVLLSGDIGNRLFNTYKAKYPDRFYNCGVAEANMTSVAAGMALCGLRPVTYTIAAFNTYRCLEQIRIDLCYQNVPVVIVGVGAGLSYASLNATHHSLEDVACLRVLPNMTVICPGDAWEVRAALREALKHAGPVYLRLGKKNEPLVHSQVPPFQIGRGIVVSEGMDVCLVSTGTMVPSAVEAAHQLELDGISARVVSMHTVKPLDEGLLKDVFETFPIVVTVEEHSILGGLGGGVAEWLADRSTPPKGRLLRMGTADHFLYNAGGQDHGRECFGLSPNQIAAAILMSYRQNAFVKSVRQ
jgi:transketolase